MLMSCMAVFASAQKERKEKLILIFVAFSNHVRNFTEFGEKIMKK